MVTLMENEIKEYDNKKDLKRIICKIEEHLSKIQKRKIDFNIFSVLKIENKELIHSRFLANLLNPKGEHNKGDFYYKKFANKFLPENPLRDSNVTIETEAHLKNQNKNLGRADIKIVNNEINKYVIIENKLYALDQWRQLKRYYDYINGISIKKGQRKGGAILYLTLNGKPASKSSLGIPNEIDYKKISYMDICDWLKDCNKENESLILTQYINTIESLIFEYQIADNIQKLNLIREFENSKSNQKQTLVDYMDKILNSIYCNLELEFWSELENKLIENKFVIDDKKKYNYEKIERSRKKGGSKISYGLICYIETNKIFRIYTNKSNEFLKIGLVNFKQSLNEWVWTESKQKKLSDVPVKNIFVEKDTTTKVIFEIIEKLTNY